MQMSCQQRGICVGVLPESLFKQYDGGPSWENNLGSRYTGDDRDPAEIQADV